MLNNDDIKKVWESIVVLDANNVIDFINKGGSKPIFLSNGYVASLSLDVLSERNQIYHLSLSNSKGKTEPKVAEIIAKEILGEGCSLLTIGTLSGCHQFIKDARNLRQNINKKGGNKKDEKIKYKGGNKKDEKK